jgi:hypothetical protein
MGTRFAIPLALLILVACGKGDAGKNDELPAALRGNYGLKPEHAQLPTVGLEVDAHALRLGELTLTIVAGEARGDDFDVTRAETRWEKTDKTRICKGTVSKQGDLLLVRLFNEGSDDRCESALDGEWKPWTRTDVLPERLLGTYGDDARSMNADIGLQLTPKTIAFTSGGAKLDIVEVVQWKDKPDEAILRDSKLDGFKCTGAISRKDDELTVSLVPAADAPEGFTCPNGNGKLWKTDPAHLPKAKTSNGKVEIEPKGDKLVLVASDIGLRCEQSILRTSTRTLAESQNDGLGVPGGALLVLDHATPTGGTEACRERLRNLAQTECSEQNGAPCSPDELQAYTSEELSCPKQIAIGEPSGGGHKAALMPRGGEFQACWDTTGVFKAP